MKSVKKVLRRGVSALWMGAAAIAAGGGLTGCAGKEAPPLPLEIGEARLEVRQLSFEEIGLSWSADLVNPNEAFVQTRELAYRVTLAGHTVAEGTKELPGGVAALGTDELILPLSLSYRELYPLLGAAGEAPEAECRVEATLTALLPGERESTVRAEAGETVPLIKPLRMRFDSLYVQDLGMMGADVVVRMETENPNSFSVNRKGFEGSLFVNNQKWSDLQVRKELLLPAGAAQESQVRIRLEFLSMGRTVRDLLSGEIALFYDFQGETLLDGAPSYMEEESLPLDLDGRISLYKPDSTVEGEHSSVRIERSIEDNLLNLFGSYRGAP